MKKIFFIIPTIGFGGAEKVFIEIADHLAVNTKYNIKLIYLTRKKVERDLPKTLTSQCLEVTNVKKSLFKLNKLITQEKPDIVFSNISHLNILLSALKLICMHQFTLIVRHTEILSNNNDTFFKKVIYKNILKYFYKKANKVIFQSKYMANDFLEIIKLENSVVINNPIDINKIKSLAQESANIQSNNKFNIGYIGRLEPVKNVEYIIKNFILNADLKSMQLHIVGDGSKRRELEEIVKDYGTSDCVIFYGEQKNPYKYLSKFNVVVNSSNSEGFPNSILEAFALNIPVLVKCHPGGTREIFESLNIQDFFKKEINFKNIKEDILPFPPNISSDMYKYYGIERITDEYIKLFN